MGTEYIQILATCPCCRVEAAVVEEVELIGAHSRVVEGRCRLCGRWEKGGTVRDPGIVFKDAEQVDAALLRWAKVEGETDVDAFVASGFSGLDRAQVTVALLGKAPVETSFDVIAWLFPGMGGGGGMGVAEPAADVAALARAAEMGPRGGGVLARSRTMDPVEPHTGESFVPADQRRLAVRALAAVMLADGVIQPGERAFLEGFASRAGLPGLDEGDVRPWRPTDLTFPEHPGPILRAMVELTFIDQQRDSSEWRVVREFARHWGHPLTELESMAAVKEDEVASSMTRMWRRLRALVVTQTVS